jgi:branched-chain amino acid transport system permease protein
VGQQIVNGLFLGSIYALFALGYTLVFGVLDILNLAHQAVFMLCAYVALVLVFHLHLPMALAFPVAVVAGGLLGLLIDRVAFRPLRGRADSNISGLISSIALATILEAGPSRTGASGSATRWCRSCRSSSSPSRWRCWRR